MKYFYQQLVGFLSVVLVSVVVCGLLFYNVMTNKIFLQRSQQLFGYAKAILVNDLTAEQINSSLSLLKDEHLGVAIFDKDNKMTYPATVLNVKSSLTDDELQHLQDGSAVNMKQTKHNFVGEAADLVTIYYPIFKNQTYNGFLAISSPLSRIETEMAELRNSILVGFSSAAVVGVILSVLFANYQTRRINRLRKATHEIAEGNYDISLPTQKRDEFDDLVMDFNKMAESLQKSEQIVLVKQNFSGAEGLQNVVDQLQELAKNKGNDLRCECPEDFTVYADYDRFIQILVNMTKNANQFTDKGHILIKGWNEDSNAIVQIIDDGIGISKKEVEAIWERFHKADVSRKSTKYGESGSGLAIVHSLMNSHHGTIQTDSEVGKGTTFTLTFPGKKEKE